MILMLTTSFCSTAGDLSEIFRHRGLSTFRLDVDRYWEYQFCFSDDEFEVVNAKGLKVASNEIGHVVSYKSHLAVDEEFGEGCANITDVRWVRSSLNYILLCIVRWAIQRSILRLWTPYEFLYPKTMQMKVAKKYFSVPSYNVHWGYSMEPKQMIVKSLVGHPLERNGYLYAKVQDVNSLSPDYPWFTQELAEGDRDATVVFINGSVNCFRFVKRRGKMIDWRITQGTKENQWERWNADCAFKEKICAFMREMNLKFGRLDFIIGGREPQFLEVNPCGQFGWLDDDNKMLHKIVADAILSPSSVVEL